MTNGSQTLPSSWVFVLGQPIRTGILAHKICTRIILICLLFNMLDFFHFIERALDSYIIEHSIRGTNILIIDDVA